MLINLTKSFYFFLNNVVAPIKLIFFPYNLLLTIVPGITFQPFKTCDNSKGFLPALCIIVGLIPSILQDIKSLSSNMVPGIEEF